MSWRKVLKEESEMPEGVREMLIQAGEDSNCRVDICNAITCMNNAYSEELNRPNLKKCLLDTVDIDSNGKCQQFEREPTTTETPKLPVNEQGFTGGQQSMIDRATRNLREEQGFTSRNAPQR